MLCLFYVNLCQYHRQTGRQTDKHIKSIVRNLTINKRLKKKSPLSPCAHRTALGTPKWTHPTRAHCSRCAAKANCTPSRSSRRHTGPWIVDTPSPSPTACWPEVRREARSSPAASDRWGTAGFWWAGRWTRAACPVTFVTPGWPGWPIAACQPIGELGPEMLNRVRKKMDNLH